MALSGKTPYSEKKMIDITHKGKTYRVKFSDRRMYKDNWQSTDYYCQYCGKQSIIIDVDYCGYADSLDQVSIATYCLECNKAFYINQ